MSVGSCFLIVCSRWLFLETVFLARFQAHSTAGRKAEISPALPSPCTHLPPRFVPLQGVHVSQQTNCTATSPSPRARGSRRGHSLLGSRPLSPDEWPARGQHGGVTRHLHRLRSSPPPATPILFCPTVPSFPQASVRSACAAFSSGLRPRSERLFLKAWLAVRGTCESALFS